MCGLPSMHPADCMDCGAEKVPCVWVMDPLFWRHCLACHARWERR